MTVWKARILDERSPEDRGALDDLRQDSSIVFLDERRAQRRALREVVPRPSDEELSEPDRWVYFPWRRAVVAILGPASFRTLRLDRNRNKLTTEEQSRLAGLTIGVVGLSVGHAVAYTLALEGICGTLRLADFDEVELSNLNRIPGSLLDLGINKAVVAARRISEIDPYLNLELYESGIDVTTIGPFFDGLDIVVEECDSLDIKVQVREAAKTHRIPLIMETSDRGLLDVERFDLDPDLPLFHGLLGDIDSESLRGLSTKDKVPFVLGQLDPSQLSARIAASMIEIDETVSTWPQLGSEVTLGAASVTAAVRRLGLGLTLPSGRVRIDLNEQLERLQPPDVLIPRVASSEPADVIGTPKEAIAQAIRRAPSGGNTQPWIVTTHGDQVDVRIDEGRTSTLDIGFRGSQVALGAALLNGRIAAAAQGMLGQWSVQEGGFTIDTSSHSDPDGLSLLHEPMLSRNTNRNLGTPTEMSLEDLERITHAATTEGCRVFLATSRPQIDTFAEILAESDRIRYLTERLRVDMMSELRWPGDDDPNRGIEVSSLGVDLADLVKFDIIKRNDVMSLLHDWDAGQALTHDMVDRVRSASAMAVVLTPGPSPTDYVTGGSAVQRVWIEAHRLGLAVQPVSPIFLYARTSEDFARLSGRYANGIATARRKLSKLVNLRDGEEFALILRLSHAPEIETVSKRLPLNGDETGKVPTDIPQTRGVDTGPTTKSRPARHGGRD